jgi:hypothetical protein
MINVTVAEHILQRNVVPFKQAAGEVYQRSELFTGGLVRDAFCTRILSRAEITNQSNAEARAETWRMGSLAPLGSPQRHRAVG